MSKEAVKKPDANALRAMRRWQGIVLRRVLANRLAGGCAFRTMPRAYSRWVLSSAGRSAMSWVSETAEGAAWLEKGIRDHASKNVAGWNKQPWKGTKP